MKFLQVLIMAYNSQDTIAETMLSYKDIADRFIICIDKKTTDNTVKIIKEMKLKSVKFHYITFTDFATARNMCLELAGNDYKWTMFVDDSYKLIRPENLIKDLKQTPDGTRAVSINICTNNNVYKSVRILKSIHNIRYIGKVHEIPNQPADYFTNGCYIEDVQCAAHAARTLDRVYDDIRVLSSCIEPTPTNLFLFANCLSTLYHNDLSKIDMAINAYNNRAAIRYDAEQRFMSSLSMGHLLIKKGILEGDRNTYKNDTIKSYLSAAIIYEPRAGECYYYIYLLTNNKYYLAKAYENRIIGNHRLNVDFRLYSNYHIGEIEQCYKANLIV